MLEMRGINPRKINFFAEVLQVKLRNKAKKLNRKEIIIVIISINYQ